jgi:hypothetical protein
MIERATIDGRPAVVAYLDENMAPTTRDRAVLIKVRFEDDGGIVFLSKPKK